MCVCVCLSACLSACLSLCVCGESEMLTHALALGVRYTGVRYTGRQMLRVLPIPPRIMFAAGRRSPGTSASLSPDEHQVRERARQKKEMCVCVCGCVCVCACACACAR